MAVKSIFDIEVDPSGKFADFAKLFEKYQTQLAKVPTAWKDAAKAQQTNEKGFDRIAAAMLAQNEQMRRQVESQKNADRLAARQAGHWTSMARSSRDFLANVTKSTVQILKWTALTTLAGGLLGGGTLFGLDRLAMNVGAGRRSSTGLGLSYGQQRAFNLNFGRVVDSGSLLGGVSDAMTDASKRSALYGAGLREQEIAGRSTGEVGAALVQRLKKLADQTPDQLLGQVHESKRVGQFISLDDFRRLKRTSTQEIAEIVRAYQRDQGALGLPNDVQKKWQDLSVQLTRAGEKIETVFVKGLSPLAPAIEKLSDSFAKALETFLKSPKLGEWIDSFGKGIEGAAKYMGSDKFQNDVRDFVKGIGELASAIGTFIRWIGAKTPDDAKVGGVLGERQGHDTWNEMVRGADKMRHPEGDKNVSPGHAASNAEREAYIRAAAKKRGIDPEQALRVARSEGFFRYTGDKGTSFGDFQLHYKNNIPGLSNAGLGDEFTRKTGLDARDPRTWKQQADFALDAAAQQGWGPWHGWRGPRWAGISKDARAIGVDKREADAYVGADRRSPGTAAPAGPTSNSDMRDLIAAIKGARSGPGSGSVVEVRNNTGGSAIVSTSQVAQ